MSDKLGLEITTIGGAESEKTINSIAVAAENLNKVFKEAKGSTSALKELRQLLVGIKGKGSGLDELSSAVKNLNSNAETMASGVRASFKSLENTLQAEFAQLRNTMLEGGRVTGTAFGKGLDVAEPEIRKSAKKLTDAAGAIELSITQTMRNSAKTATEEAKKLGVAFSEISRSAEAGRTRNVAALDQMANALARYGVARAKAFENSGQQKAVPDNGLRLLTQKVQEDTASLNAAYRKLEETSKLWAKISLKFGEQRAVPDNGLRLLTQRVQEDTVSLNAAYRKLEEASKLRDRVLSTLGQQKAVPDNGLRLLTQKVQEDTASLNAAYRKLEETSKLWAKISLKFGEQRAVPDNGLRLLTQKVQEDTASLNAAYRKLEEVAALKERIQARLSKVTPAPSDTARSLQGSGQQLTTRAGLSYDYGSADYAKSMAEMRKSYESVNFPAQARQVGQVSTALNQMTLSGNNAHSMARGLASAFGLLWLTWGNLAPLFTGAGISFGLKKTFDIGSEVEYLIRLMEELGQTTDETGKRMVGAGTILRAELRAIDQETQFSLVELTQGMVRLGQAGKTQAESLAMLKPAAHLASLGLTDLKVSVDLLIQTQALFNKTAADTPKISAQILQITKSSVLNVEDIAGSMKYASEANTRFGKSLEETLTLLGALAQAGLKGSTGGTALINFYRDLNGRSGPAIAGMKALEKATNSSIKVFDQFGKQRSGIDIFTDIAEASKKLKAEDADKLLAKIFSDRGGRTFFAMLREGTVDLNKMVQTLKDVDPNSLFKAASGLMDTTKGAMDILKGSLVGVFDKVFEGFSEKFKTVILDFTKLVDSGAFTQSLAGIVGGMLGLYETLKTLSPALVTFFSVWAGSKIVFGTIALFQGVATALAGLAPTLAMSTGAYWKKTVAVEANSTAMIGNIATQRALAAGMAAEAAAAHGAAVAQSTLAVKTGLAGVAMRGLGAAIAFLANPLVGIITTLGLVGFAWWQSSQAADKAMGATTGSVLKNGAINMAQWSKEIALLRTRANLLGGDQYSGVEQEVNKASTKLAKTVADYLKLTDQIADSERRGDMNLRGTGTTVRLAKANADAMLAQMVTQEKAINTARNDLSELRLKDQLDAEEAQRKQLEKHNAEMARLQGTISVPKTSSGGGREAKGNERQQFLMLQFSNELKQIEARMKSEIKLKETAYEADKKTLETRYAANLLSAVEYQSELTRLTQTSEKDRIGTYRAATQEYNQIMAEQLSGMENAYLRQIKGADVQNPGFKALKEGITGVQEVLKSTDQAYQDFATQLAQGNPSAEANLAETLLKNESALDRWVAQVKQQIDSLPEGPLKKLAAEMLNTAQAGITFNEATNNLSKGLSIKLLQDAEKAYADLAKQVGDATRAGQDFWRKSAETKEAAAALRQVEEHYSGVTDASTVALQAEKAGALARVQSLQASSEAMLQQRVAADAVAASLKDLYAQQAKALENGPTDVSGLSNLIKDTEALAASLQKHLAKGAANSGVAAGEAFALAYKGSVEQIFTTLSAMDFARGFHDTSDALADMLQGLDKAILAQEAYNLVKASTNDPQKLAKLEAQNSKNQIRSYGDMASAAKGFFREGSKGYKSLDTVSKAFRAAELAGAVFNTGKKLVLMATEVAAAGVAEANKTAISNTGEAARMPAKIAGIFASFMSMMGPWGVPAAIAAIAAVGLSAYGKSNSNTLAPTNEGKGTVFGDKEAKSESIGKTIDLLEGISKFAGIENSYAAKMLTSLRSIENSMGGVTNLVLRSNGAENAAAKVQQGYSDNGMTKAVSGAGTVMTVAKLVMGALNPLGFIADMLLGKLLAPIITKLFGTKTTVTGQGLYAADTTLDQVRAGGLEAGYYADINKKKKFFGVTYSDKNSTNFTKDDETSRQFSLILNGFVDSVKLAAPVLGFSLDQIDTNLKDFVVKIGRVDLKDLSGAEIQEKLAAVFGAVGDDIAKAAIPGLEHLQQVGEGYFETLARVASNLSSVNQMFDTLGVELLDSSIAGAEASIALAELFGGLEDMASMVGGYYENFYTEAERELVLRRQLTEALTKQNLQMPVTRDGYRALVEAQDLTTEAGRKNFAALMQNEAAFAKLTPAADSAATSIDNLVSKLESAFPAATASIKSLITEINRLSKLRNTVGNLLDKLADKIGGDSDFAKKREAELWAALAATTDLEKQIELAEALSDIVIARHQKEVDAAKTLLTFSQSLKTYVDGLKIGNISPLTTAEKLAEAGKQYNETLTKAKGGDVTAQGELQKAADAYLNLARTYYASSSAYTAIFDSVTGALSGLGANVKSQAEQQLEVGTNSLDELKKLYGTTETISFAIESQYNSAIEQLKVERDALASQLRTEDEFKAFNELFRGLPVELSGLFKDMLSGILKYSDERVAQAIREVKVSDPKSTIAGITDSAYKNFGISSTQIASVTPTLYSDKEVLSALQALRATDPAATLGAIRSTAYNNYGITPEQFNRVVKMDGSHYDGLDYVPFDGYIAELHKGERVITASENTAYSKNDNSELIEEISALRREVALLRESNREEANRQVEVTIKAAEVTGDIISSATNKAVHSKALKEKATVR